MRIPPGGRPAHETRKQAENNGINCGHEPPRPYRASASRHTPHLRGRSLTVGSLQHKKPPRRERPKGAASARQRKRPRDGTLYRKLPYGGLPGKGPHRPAFAVAISVAACYAHWSTFLRWHDPDQVQRDQGIAALSQPLRAPPVEFLTSTVHAPVQSVNPWHMLAGPPAQLVACSRLTSASGRSRISAIASASSPLLASLRTTARLSASAPRSMPFSIPCSIPCSMPFSMPSS